MPRPCGVACHTRLTAAASLSTVRICTTHATRIDDPATTTTRRSPTRCPSAHTLFVLDHGLLAATDARSHRSLVKVAAVLTNHRWLMQDAGLAARRNRPQLAAPPPPKLHRSMLWPVFRMFICHRLCHLIPLQPASCQTRAAGRLLQPVTSCVCVGNGKKQA